MSNVIYKLTAALLMVLIIGIMVISCDRNVDAIDDPAMQGIMDIQNAHAIDWDGCSDNWSITLMTLL